MAAGQIMVLGGTADARVLLRELTQTSFKVIVTVTTGYGKELLEDLEGVETFQGKLDSQGMLEFIQKKDISLVVDASHPFAKDASQNAMEACTKAKVPYLRFERKSLNQEGQHIIKVKSFEDAADRANLVDGNIFLTIGSNHIKVFVDRVTDYRKRLFVRILPLSSMVLKCEQAGLAADNIFAVKGPFTTEFNIAMLKKCNASVMVTKESGETGGVGEKLKASKELHIPVILVERPEITYTQKVSSVKEVMEYIEKME